MLIRGPSGMLHHIGASKASKSLQHSRSRETSCKAGILAVCWNSPRSESFISFGQRHCVSHVESKKAILPGCLRQIWVGTPEIGARTTSRLMALYIRYDLASFFPQIVQIWAGQTDLISVQDAISLVQPKAVVLMSFGDWSWLRVQHQCWFQLFGKAVAPGRSAFRFNWHFYMFLHLHFGTCRVCVHVCTLFIEWLETIWYDHDLCNLFNGHSTAPATFGNADFISDWWAAVVPLKRSCKAAKGAVEAPWKCQRLHCWSGS